MKRKCFSILYTAVAAVMLASSLFGGGLSGFYSDFAQLTANVGIGSVNPVIANIRLEADGVEKTEEELSQSSSFISVNKSDVFSFSVINGGRNAITYELDIQIAWEEDLRESGKLLVYPYETGDDAICQSLKDGRFEGAVIGYGADDGKQVTTPAGIRAGISETVDSDVLPGSASGGEDGGGSASKEYRFRLFFYEDQDIASSPVVYHNKNATVNFIVRAALDGNEDGWTGTEKKSFGVTSVIDTIYPVIHEVSRPKTYFITQAEAIAPAAYAVATDVLDGDITGNIVINSSPQFDPQKAGVYNLTYTVSNSLGNPAAPLHITIVVWDFVKITSGYYHTLALTSHGKVYVWGYNYYGQLGDGTTTDRSVPKQLDGLDNIIDIAAGVGCSYALSADGQAYAWGRGENGRLGDNTTTGKNKPVKVAQPDGVKFVQISGRFATGGGVTAEGDVYTWGYGGYGTAGTGKASDIHAPAKINLSNVAQVELGYYNGVAVTKDGAVCTWGSNTYGQLGTGAASSPGPNPVAPVPYFSDENIRVKQVSAGYYHMAAVSEDGRVFTWGYGYEGRLGNGTTSNKFVPQPIAFAAPAQKALAGYYHTGVLTSDGAAYFFGQNVYGKLGNGNSTNQSTPVKLGSVGNVTDFSLAYDSSFVLSGSVDIYGMGYGGTGVLGTGNNNNSGTAVKWAFTPPPPY